MSTLVPLKDVVEQTGLTLRHWQARARRDEIPSVKVYECGQSVRYFVDPDVFQDWWRKQLKDVKPWCEPKTRGTSKRAVSGSGSGGRTRANFTGSPSKHEMQRKLANGGTATKRKSEVDA